MRSAHGGQLSHAIEGLYVEAKGFRRTEPLDLWAALIRQYVGAVIGAVVVTDPLAKLWAEVDASIAEPWTLGRLSGRAGVHPETLRRLSLAHQGRSPMQYVTHLRMRRAEALLSSTTSKLFTIARNVGYANTFAFNCLSAVGRAAAQALPLATENVRSGKRK